MGIGIFTRQPFSRNVTGVERNGEVGMVTLAHQVNPPREENGVVATKGHVSLIHMVRE